MKSMEEMMAAAQEAAQTVQRQMNEAQAKLESIEVEGAAGGGLVKVRATAKGRILGVSIDDSLMVPGDHEVLADLIMAAHADAKRRLDAINGDLMREAAGPMAGMNIPGMPKLF